MQYNELTKGQQNQIIEEFFGDSRAEHSGWVSDIVSALQTSGAYSISILEISNWFNEMDEGGQRVFLDLPESDEPLEGE